MGEEASGMRPGPPANAPAPIGADRRIGWTGPHALLIFAVVALVYAAGAELSWRLFGADNLGLAFFPPAGLTLAALVVLPRRRWWAVLAAVAVAETGIDLAHGLDLGISLGYAAANMVEPTVGALVLARLGRGQPVDLERLPGVFRYLVAAVGIGPAVGAALGGVVRHLEDGTGWLPAALHWWAGDGLAVLAVGTSLLLLGGTTWPRWTPRELAEPLAAMVATLVVSVLAFWRLEAPPTILVLPVLLWVAVRYGVRGVAVASTIIAVVANLATAAGNGPFARMDASPQSRLAWLQLFLATLIVAAWFVAVETRSLVRVRAREEQERAARERAESVRALGALSADLVRAVTVDDVVEVVEDHLRRLVRTDHAVLTRPVGRARGPSDADASPLHAAGGHRRGPSR